MQLYSMNDIKSAFINNTNLSEKEIQTIINNMPIAFDKDKVINELEEYISIALEVNEPGIYAGLSEAIDVVNAGGLYEL